MRRRNFMRYYTKFNCFSYPMLIFPSKCLFSSWHGWRGWDYMKTTTMLIASPTLTFEKCLFSNLIKIIALNLFIFSKKRPSLSLKQINAISLAITLLSVNVFVNRTQIIQLGINFTSLIWLDLRHTFLQSIPH